MGGCYVPTLFFASKAEMLYRVLVGTKNLDILSETSGKHSNAVLEYFPVEAVSIQRQLAGTRCESRPLSYSLRRTVDSPTYRDGFFPNETSVTQVRRHYP